MSAPDAAAEVITRALAYARMFLLTSWASAVLLSGRISEDEWRDRVGVLSGEDREP